MPRKKSTSPKARIRKGWACAAVASILSEADLERYGTDLLELDGWRALKTDPVSDRSRGKGFGEKGMADHLYLRYGPPVPEKFDLSPTEILFVEPFWVMGEILWIEWKRRKGKPKPHQIAWIENERKRGAVVWLADKDFVATPEGFFDRYERSGLMRKPLSPSLMPFRGRPEIAELS